MSQKNEELKNELNFIIFGTKEKWDDNLTVLGPSSVNVSKVLAWLTVKLRLIIQDQLGTYLIVFWIYWQRYFLNYQVEQ